MAFHLFCYYLTEILDSRFMFKYFSLLFIFDLYYQYKMCSNSLFVLSNGSEFFLFSSMFYQITVNTTRYQ